MLKNNAVKAGSVRYEVTVTTGDSKVSSEFIRWMEEEHGDDLLACDGCYEYRVLSAGENVFRAEYLFLSQDHLDRYLEQDAPRLRAKGIEKFSGKDISFERSVSQLVLCSTS